ncbi:MAG: nitrate reductase cytochrome c-type subunit [Coriobacteriaceae bacterium]|jgi:cytochrome c-type protein NapB|nr:nitrate reductase cytochrome c-type subunit [Coriobacteriaceae bacterium]
MKNKLITLLAVFVLAFSFVALVGCTTEAEVTGMPPLAPADHNDGRFDQGAVMCYSCHGNGPNGNPNDAEARMLPEDHYVDASYDSKEIFPARAQCNTCHLLTPSE